MQYMDQFFDYLPKLCKLSNLKVLFAGFTSDDDATIDKSLLNFAKEQNKYGHVILYVRQEDFDKIEKVAELRICHAFVVRGKKLNTVDKFVYQNTLKQFLSYIKEKEGAELDWDGDTSKPLYLDSYYDLHHFTFDEKKEFTEQFRLIIEQICLSANKSQEFANIFVSVLHTYYRLTGIEPAMIEETHYLNYAKSSLLRRMSLKRLKEIHSYLLEELRNDKL